jgi:hypothetical protein
MTAAAGGALRRGANGPPFCRGRTRRRLIDAATFEAAAPIIPAAHRSTLKRIAAMSSQAGTYAAARHSISALLDENSASSTMTLLISIREY